VTSIQSDDKILVGGDFTDYDGNTSNFIVRLNSDGVIDSTFNIGTGFNARVLGVSIQSDGKILIGGGFDDYDGNTANRIIRLNDDGSIDSTFNIGTGFTNIGPDGALVHNVLIQSDGKILVGGDFDAYDGNTANRIIRLNDDGSIDSAFNIGTGFNASVFGVSIQSDGKIIVGGDFTTYDGNTANRIIRLNDDGSIDSTFNIGTGFNNTVRVTSIQSDGKILVGGDFTDYGGNTSNRIIRLNDDGSIDSTFNIGTGFNDTVFSVSSQFDGKILVGGGFVQYDNDLIIYMVRLFGDTPPPFYNKLTFDYNGTYYIGSY
jgi:uncharacterized delta-60 repeat protein